MLLEIGLHFFIPKGFIHPLVAIVADIVLVLTGGVIQYGLMKLIRGITLKRRKNFFSKVIIMDCGMDCNQIMNIFSKS